MMCNPSRLRGEQQRPSLLAMQAEAGCPEVGRLDLSELRLMRLRCDPRSWKAFQEGLSGVSQPGPLGKAYRCKFVAPLFALMLRTRGLSF